jgi:ketol-acid reductoisomerase
MAIKESVREEMAEILEEIQNGSFAREWEAEHQIEVVGKKLRSMMRGLK